MARISFFKQVRNDAGVRCGIMIDGEALLMHFTAGSGIDPSLLWYVDVEFEAESLNGEPEQARQLFLQYTQSIKIALAEVIVALQSEVDPLVWPVSSGAVQVKEGVKLKVVCSAIRRIPSRILAQALTELKENWEQHLNDLEPVTSVSAG